MQHLSWSASIGMLKRPDSFQAAMKVLYPAAVRGSLLTFSQLQRCTTNYSKSSMTSS